MDIRQCITDLLTVHDCVIIPGLGGFIGNYSPARIDPVHHTFQPPFKKLLFNVNLKQNDGLLANAVADSFGTSYSDACALIDRFEQECRHALVSGQFFLIPGVGRLYSGREGNVQFEQDKSANLFPGSFGLTGFISPPISRNSSLLGMDPRMISSVVSQPGKKFTLPRVVRWAAILALPVGLSLVVGLTRYGRISPGNESNAGILSSVFSRFSSASLVEKKEAPRTKVIPRSAPAPAAVPAAVPAPQPEPTVSAISPDDRFAIIVGVFRMKENAENFVSELNRNGIEAAIFDRSRTGLYRVTVGTCSNHDSAGELLALAKSSAFRDAWLLAK